MSDPHSADRRRADIARRNRIVLLLLCGFVLLSFGFGFSHIMSEQAGISRPAAN